MAAKKAAGNARLRAAVQVMRLQSIQCLLRGWPAICPFRAVHTTSLLVVLIRHRSALNARRERKTFGTRFFYLQTFHELF